MTAPTTGAAEMFEVVRLETIGRIRKHYESCGFAPIVAQQRAELRVAYLLHLASLVLPATPPAPAEGDEP